MEIPDIWWPQCCFLDNERLDVDDLDAARCPYAARWEIRGYTLPMVHSCDEHVHILLEEGTNTVRKL